MAFRDDVSINSFIGLDTSISGNIHASGFTRVDGDIDGNIEVDGRIIIGDKARIRGNITATSAIIGGIIEGDIVAPDGVQLFSTASVIGDIVAQKIILDENVLFQGRSVVVCDAEEFEKEKIEWQEQRAVLNKSRFVSQENG